MTLFYPEVSGLMVDGMLDTFAQRGQLRQWASLNLRCTMVGNNADCVLAGAIVRGIRRDSAADALLAMIDDQTQVGFNQATGRDGVGMYNSKGYVDSAHEGSVSKTLDYAWNDFCISRVVQITGAKSSLKTFTEKAKTHLNVYDRSIKFFRERDKSRRFESFDKFRWGSGFVEGNPFHYRFSVPHDVQALIALSGATRRLSRSLRMSSPSRRRSTSGATAT